jgi:hypothetical protein
MQIKEKSSQAITMIISSSETIEAGLMHCNLNSTCDIILSFYTSFLFFEQMEKSF